MSLERQVIINGNSSSTDENEATRPIYFVSTHNTTIEPNITGIKSTVSGLNAARPEEPPITIKQSFRKSSSLKDQLMYRPLCKRRVRKCGKNCTFCEYIHEGESLRLKNGMIVTCNGNFECTSRNIIYIATCSGCKESYLGETGDELQSRWVVHRQQSKLQPREAPVHADVHLRLCGKNTYSVYPFFRPRRNDVNLRRRYEDDFVKKFKPRLNGKLY